MYKCYIQDQIVWIEQDSAYEACHHTHMSLHLPLHIRDVKKKSTPYLVLFKKLQGVQQIACLKQQCFLSFTFYKTQRSYEKIMCVYFLFFNTSYICKKKK